MPRARPYVIAPDPGSEGRREYKKAQTRDDLVEAALRLFSEAGFQATTVEDIAAEAKVSPRTFFRYFASKEEVLFPRKDEDLAALDAALNARPSGESALEALRATVVEYLRRFQEDRDFHLLRIQLIREAPSLEAYGLQLHQEWIRVLARSLARRMKVNPAGDPRPLLLAGCGIIAMRSALVPWFQAKGKIDIGVFAVEAFDQMQRGFPRLMQRKSLLAALLVGLAGCATLVPNIHGVWVAADAPVIPPSAAPPALALIGDTGVGRGEDTVRLARAVARELRDAPSAPVLVLGDVFYSRGLLGIAPGQPEDQLESVLGPYRAALSGNPLIAIGGNHDYYGGRAALDNACSLLPRAAVGWRYVARGCGLDDAHPVDVLDLGAIAVFLLDSEPMIRDREFRRRTLEALGRELERFQRKRPATALLIATHHPLETHGTHNGAGLASAVRKDFHPLSATLLFPFHWLLRRRLGQQDVYEYGYRAYRRDLYRLLRDRPIQAFVSGHDHNLQHVALEHPGVRHQLVSGAGTHRSPVKRLGLDLLWNGRLARLLGLRDVLPAPRHRLLFGLGGKQVAPDLTAWGFATLTPLAGGLHVEFFDAAHEAPVYSALLSSAGVAATRVY